jgi:hypothetical protein
MMLCLTKTIANISRISTYLLSPAVGDRIDPLDGEVTDGVLFLLEFESK